ncbi:MAG: hypothetical protein K2H43_00770, partial [Clostridia bacterium]|nr:hypothetical protein [Clostridia bacterium]
LRSPRGEFLPLLKSSLPVTAMRTSSSLMNSFISVLFPARLIAAGCSSSKALAEYGVVYGMVMPVMMIPSTLISSIALVLVPELSESFYKKQKDKVEALVEKALNTTLLVAAILIPLFITCGEGVGIMLYSNAQSGKLIANSALILLPMSATMICTSLLNSMNCERHTLAFFLLGSAAMLACVFVLPQFLGSGALLVGMACDFGITAICSLVLLKKKAGKLRSGKYFLRLALVMLPITVVGVLLRNLLFVYLDYLAALVVTALTVLLLQALSLSAFRLFDFRTFLKRFFVKKRKKAVARS